MKAWLQSLREYLTFNLLCVLLMGFSSGLPLALTGSTLTAWLSDSHVSLTHIGLFAAAATPYAFKFLWAPFMDSLPLPVLTRWLGRRRGWMLATQAALMLALCLMSAASPELNPWVTAAMAVLVAFLSASQDIVIDAYRIDILPPDRQGHGAAMTQLGYRLGMIASSYGALHLAARWGWSSTYLAMGGLMLVGILTTFMAREPYGAGESKRPGRFADWFQASVIAPFADFMRNSNWWLILTFIVIYRLADAFIGGMTNPFLLQIGFTKEAIANIVKVYGTIATLVGIFIGGALTARLGPFRIMMVAGVMHALTNLFYVLQAQMGANIAILAMATVLENVTGGIAGAAFVAYLSNLTNIHYTATQYALLSALAAFGRTLLSTPAGWVADHLGWSMFFFFSALLALPGLLLLLLLNRRLFFQNR